MDSSDAPVIPINNFKIVVCDFIYEPSDDTFLLYDAVKSLTLRKRRVVEIGCGVGLVTLELARNNIVLATDLNLEAVKCTLKNLKMNGLYPNVDLICCDSLKPVREFEIFDYVFFNPPYIPTEAEEDMAWSGGSDGIEVSEKFILDSIKRLKKTGRIVCVFSSCMNLKKLYKLIDKLGLRITIKSKKKFFFEELYIAILERKNLYNKQR